MLDFCELVVNNFGIEKHYTRREQKLMGEHGHGVSKGSTGNHEPDI